MKQVRSYLLAHGFQCKGSKQIELIRTFALNAALEVQGAPDDWLVGLWLEAKNSHVFKVEEKFTKSREWISLRKVALAKYGTFCMKCGRAGCASVDHIKPRSLFPDLALDIGNLQILCVSCNSMKGNRSQEDYRSLKQNLANLRVNSRTDK